MPLHYYSPKAYEFVHKISALPHSSSVGTWAASVDCEPGYLMNVIQLLGKALQEKKWMSDVVLVVNEMMLCSEAVWDPKAQKFVGNIDYGTAIPELTDSEAAEALFFYGCRNDRKLETPYCLCSTRQVYKSSLD